MEHKRPADGWLDTFWKIEAYDERQVEQPDGSYWFHNLHRQVDWLSLHFVSSGRMLYIDRDGPQQVPPGHALMFANHEDSEYGVPNDFDEPLVTAWISFSGRGLRDHWTLIRQRFGSVFYLGAESPIRETWQQLSAHLEPRTPVEMSLASTAVHGFVMQLYAYLEQRQRPAQSPVDRVVDDLLRHPTHPWSLKQLAARHGCTREHLSRVFRQRVGTTPGNYLTQARLNKALDLLRCSTLPVWRVAEASGFGSAHTLARWVRSETGMSPSAVRQKGSVAGDRGRGSSRRRN